jgi:hypothetical protein
MLYEIFIGKPPLPINEGNIGVIHKNITGSTCSDYLKELMIGILQIDPESRLDIDDVLASGWFHDAVRILPVVNQSHQRVVNVRSDLTPSADPPLGYKKMILDHLKNLIQ